MRSLLRAFEIHFGLQSNDLGVKSLVLRHLPLQEITRHRRLLLDARRRQQVRITEVVLRLREVSELHQPLLDQRFHAVVQLAVAHAQDFRELALRQVRLVLEQFEDAEVQVFDVFDVFAGHSRKTAALYAGPFNDERWNVSEGYDGGNTLGEGCCGGAGQREREPWVPACAGMTGSLETLVEERPAEHPAEVVDGGAAQGHQVLAGAQMAREVYIPFEPVVAAPPRLPDRAVGDQLAVHVQPGLVEQAREHQVRVARRLGRREFQLGLVPPVAGVVLAVGVEQALGLQVKVGGCGIPVGRAGIAPAPDQAGVPRVGPE